MDGVECRSGDFKVYNFEISEYHTYYVSSLEIFVHNMCGDGVGVGKGGNKFAASTDGSGGGAINSVDEARKIQQRLNALSIQGNKVRGFRNAGELIERVGHLRNRLNNLGVSDAQVGIRGSSVTNQSSKGGFFRFFSTNAGKKSDIDFFIASPSLEKKLDQFFTSSGVIKPDDLKRVDPELGDILSIFGQETRK